MQEQTPATPPKHLDYLDAARGIAALMVMTYHYINWKYDQRTGARLASMIFNGADAVSFFFVLSGFVLSYKYIILKQPLDIRNFYISRFFRLWPGFFIVVVLNALNANRGDLSLHMASNMFLHDTSQFWEEAFLFRPHSVYYGPGWTLTIELCLSFFIPFWVVLAKKGTNLILWVFVAFILSGDTSFNFHFGLGVLCCCLYPWLTGPSFKETKWHRFRYPLIAIALVLFSIRHIDKISPLGPTYKYLAGYFQVNFFHYTGFASFIFIAAILNSKRTQQILRHRILTFLGKISYGVYLVHWLLVIDVFAYWDRIAHHFPSVRVAFIVVFFIYAGVTILLATLMHYIIERPFIKLGKKLAARLKPSFVIN